MDRSNWTMPTEADAISAARAALKAINHPFTDVSLVADLLEYMDDGVWLVVPNPASAQGADVSVTIDVRSGTARIGGYSRATIKENLSGGE